MSKMTLAVCDVLRQFGFRYSLTALHTVHPNSESFSDDLRQFVSVCRVVRGLRKARLGAIGARPNAFATVRYSEKLLQDHGISVSTLDLSEVLGAAKRMADRDARVQRTLAEIGDYASTEGVPAEPLLRMAKFALVVAVWMDENSLDTTAVQCWNSIQRNYGINPCTVMSMMSEKLMPSACEVDVTGVVSMYALQLASGTPSALVDWNNNYGDEPDKCVLFHCGNTDLCPRQHRRPRWADPRLRG